MTFILILVGYAQSVFAQTYFSNRYEYFGWTEVPWNVVQTDSGYMTFGGVNTDATLINGIGVMHVDSFGNVLWKKYFGDTQVFNYFPGGPGSLVSTQGGGYIMAGSVDDSTGDSDALLYKFDYKGDTLWTKKYGDNSWQAAIQCKVTSDGGFIIIGKTTTYDPDPGEGDFWLIKSDSLGNIEWDTIYGGQYDDYGLSIDVCDDGGYILAGTTRSYGVNSGPFSNNATNKYVIKVDNAGVEEWSVVIGNEFGECLWNVQQTLDGGYIIGGCVMYDDLQAISRPNLIKLDSLGNIEWNTTYGQIRFNTTLYMVRELSDGSFISAGQVHDPFGGHGMGLVIKTAANGDSLWYRTHDLLQGAMSWNHFRDIKPTSDGGFVATGYVWPADVGDTGSQDIWIVKLDSMGCEVENCFTGVSDVQFSKDELQFTVYPNPFSGTATVKLNIEPAYRTGRNGTPNVDLRVYDITGRRVRTYSLSKGQTTLTLKANEIGTGMFLVRLISNDRLSASQRIVILEY